jgi:hypothetical protein
VRLQKSCCLEEKAKEYNQGPKAGSLSSAMGR